MGNQLSSLDGRHQSVTSIRGIFQKHYTDLGIAWQAKYDEYEAAKKVTLVVDRKPKEKLEGTTLGEMILISMFLQLAIGFMDYSIFPKFSREKYTIKRLLNIEFEVM